MSNVILNILASVVASGALVWALLWLTKTWITERLKNAIKHEYDGKLAALRAEQETALEKLRSDLRLRETLREDRAPIVAETYSRLHELYTRVHVYVMDRKTSSDADHAERRDAVTLALRKFGEYYPAQLIYLPATTEQRVHKFHQVLLQLALRFLGDVIEAEGKETETGRDDWGGTFEEMRDEAKRQFEELKADFRRLLGDGAIIDSAFTASDR